MLTLADILAARQIIQPYVWRTPLVSSAGLSQRSGAEVYLKLECWQRTGSFKLRGALVKLNSLTREEQVRGVVTASAGNHGLGVAYASQVLGQPAVTIFVPENTPTSKLDHLAAFNCRIRRVGGQYDEAHAAAEVYVREHQATYVSAYDDPAVISGQATVGLEILEDLPTADLLLVPVGGGGLIAGIALAARAINPGIRIIGLQPEASPAAFLSLRDGRPYETYPAGPTICDGLAGGFGRVPFEMAAALIDQILVVSEADVRRSIAWLLAHEQLVVEGAGAIAVAPLLNAQLEAAGKRVVAVLSGRNLDASLLQDVLNTAGAADTSSAW